MRSPPVDGARSGRDVSIRIHFPVGPDTEQGLARQLARPFLRCENTSGYGTRRLTMGRYR
jgi:hypothetical protein